MLVRVGGKFRVIDYSINDNGLYIETTVKPNFDVLRNSGSLIVNGETKRMIKTAKLVTIAPKATDFLYIRNRAVSASNVIDSPNGGPAELVPLDLMYQQFPRFAFKIRGANDNGDFFSHEELLTSYKTFIGKAVFVDHQNDNVENARGIILDAVYNDKGKFVELLKAIDRKAYPELARGIEMGYITATSMGCRVEYSLCTVCGNKATTEEEFCDHVKNYKASTFNGLPVWEDNRNCNFIEDSLVAQAADHNAVIFERVASKHSNHNHRRKTTQKSQFSSFLNMRDKIRNEKNQRTHQGQIKAFFDELNDLPWG